MKKITEHPSLADTINFELTIPQDTLYCVEKVVILCLNTKTKEAVPVLVQEQSLIDLHHVGPGRYEWHWQPQGQREGSYFITWHYRLVKDGPLQTQSAQFYLTAAVPAHRTITDKYTTLLDRLLPSVYKAQITDDDLTPMVIKNLHAAVAKGFTDIENLAIQLADITDANYTSEALMPILASFFDLKLRTSDSAQWRRQIKQAPSLYKAKGTLSALQQALDQAGIKLTKLTKLWQVVSPYYWVDTLMVKDNDHTFTLSKQPLEIKRVGLRAVKESTYVELPKDYISILSPTKAGEKFKAVWTGLAKKETVHLFPGDIVRVEYNYRVMTPEQEELNNYIISLPLADQRDEASQDYPLKNWNVRVMEEDDPLFSRIITDRHPFHAPLVFGKVRTTFMYSEQIYNMDTYDGSLRDSSSPCDIDKDFLDSCANCQTSKFNVDLEISNLTNDRLQEAAEIIEEYAPFHAVLHSMNVRGRLEDFMLPPTDKVESKVTRKPGIVDEIKIQDRVALTIHRKDGSKKKE